jgi:serine/threonine protein kinase/Tfp pilus assembly protein PilF
MNEESIFINAVQKQTPEERDVYLDEACANNAELRQSVELLLKAHDKAGHFLQGVPRNDPTMDQSDRQGPGMVIGPYKLLQPIGEGGMGTVYMAEQTQPVRRTVALKLIKAGMDSRQVLARFGAERQALALMDHPNIAMVFDAGTTDTGRPYFVTELVKGIPITRFCDERRLTTRERLELAIPVCQALQHAHQKGIIHRDLKPSNVLIALYDGKPVPKVIDFGVAKATGPRLTDQTLYTEFGAVVGTLEYVSPEQAELNQLDIDTRSDIYSLGVLLYELLTGTTPLDRKRLKAAAILELLRVIREEESPRPSTRLSTTEELPSIAACRNIEPRKLSGLMRGELDWIVMKALEKDRNRRYETANGLAADLRRYLDDEPVLACPPSAGYRLGKLARRNRGLLATTGLVTLVLIAGIVSSTWQAIRALRAERAALTEASRATEAERQATEQRDEAILQRQRADTRFRLAFQSVQKLAGVYGYIRSTAGPERTAKMQRAITEDLIRYDLELVENNEDDPAVTFEVGDAYLGLSELYRGTDLGRSDRAFFKALAVYERQVQEKPDDTGILNGLAYQYWRLARRYQEKEPGLVEPNFRRSLDLVEKVAREHPDHVDDWIGIRDLAMFYGGWLRSQGRPTEASELDRRALAWFERPEVDLQWFDKVEEHRGEAFCYFADMLIRCGKLAEAIPVLKRERSHLLYDSHYDQYRDIVTYLCLKLTADPDPSVRAKAVPLARENVEFFSQKDARTWLLLGLALVQTEKLSEADHAFARAMELGGDDTCVLNNIAWLLVTCPDPARRNPARGVMLARKSVELGPKEGNNWNTLGVAQYRKGDWKAAIDALTKSMELLPGKHESFNTFFLAKAHCQLGDNPQARIWHDKAVEWMEKNQPKDEELVRFRAEAAALLGGNSKN